jgi:3'-phosphoadenosine 5'-phosphosulfate sulfotransferase (PAPS reductase)/FAD synthetase
MRPDDRRAPESENRHDPDALIERARSLHAPIASVCLISGGDDSTALAHRCRGAYDRLAFLDTGTAVPGVVEFVREVAAWLGKPLTIVRAGDAYRRLVLGGPRADGGWEDGYGFPGPGQHAKAYTRLKERQLDTLMRQLKQGRSRYAKVLLLSGVRRAESARRAQRQSITKHRGKVFCNPLIDWTADDLRRYRRLHGLPQSPVAALLHRSGECNCGAFAAAGEREMLRSLWPTWFETTIAALEREAAAAGIPACRWGERPPSGRGPAGRPLCSSCVARHAQPAEVS